MEMRERKRDGMAVITFEEDYSPNKLPSGGCGSFLFAGVAMSLQCVKILLSISSVLTA